MTATTPFPDYVDLVEAARVLGIHPHSARRLIKQRLLPAEIRFGRRYLIRRDQLQQFAANYDAKPGRRKNPIRLF